MERYIGPQQWYEIFKHTNDPACYAVGFHTHAAFVEAASAFPGFASDADDAANRREVATFLAQISHETTGKIAASSVGHSAFVPCPALFFGTSLSGSACHWWLLIGHQR